MKEKKEMKKERKCRKSSDFETNLTGILSFVKPFHTIRFVIRMNVDGVYSQLSNDTFTKHRDDELHCNVRSIPLHSISARGISQVKLFSGGHSQCT